MMNSYIQHDGNYIAYGQKTIPQSVNDNGDIFSHFKRIAVKNITANTSFTIDITNAELWESNDTYYFILTAEQVALLGWGVPNFPYYIDYKEKQNGEYEVECAILETMKYGTPIINNGWGRSYNGGGITADNDDVIFLVSD